MRLHPVLLTLLALLGLPHVAAAQLTGTLAPPAVEGAIVPWLQQKAIPLRHVEFGNGFEDLQPLKQALKDVKILGLGEATHGTREFFQVRHRLLEFLVTEMGFNGFTIEASYAASQAINEYVLHGTGDLATVLTEQGYVAWDTEEFTEMLAWMQSYNQGVSDEKKIRFYGLDVWNNEVGRKQVLGYLRKVAPEIVGGTESFFQVFSREEAKWPNRLDERAQEAMLPLLLHLQDLIGFLIAHRETLISRSSPAEFDQALQYVHVMKQWLMNNTAALQLPGVGSSIRSVFMAENLIYLADRAGQEAKFVVWAHNGHVAKRGRNIGMNMGQHLRTKYGDAYYAFGLEFNEGSFQHRLWLADNSLGNLGESSLPPAPTGSFPWFMSRANVGNAILNLRTEVADPVVNRWLQAPQQMHVVGWVYPGGDALQFVNAWTYDGIVFIGKTTSTRPTANAMNNVAIPGGVVWTF
jgi:erythromycin esterase